MLMVKGKARHRSSSVPRFYEDPGTRIRRGAIYIEAWERPLPRGILLALFSTVEDNDPGVRVKKRSSPPGDASSEATGGDWNELWGGP